MHHLLFWGDQQTDISCGNSSLSVTIPDLHPSRTVDFNESLNRLMIHPDVDTKTNMPDGSAVLAETLHTEMTLPTINGDQESPADLPPESPEDKGIIRCTPAPPLIPPLPPSNSSLGICGIDEDDGFTIFCDRCSVWQHGACVGIYDAKDAPDKYLCDECNPRPLDIQKAIRLQRQRQEQEQQTNHKPKRRTSSHPKTKPNPHIQNSASSSLGPSPTLPPPQSRKEKHPSPPRRTDGKKPRAAGRGGTASQVEIVAPSQQQQPSLPTQQEEVDVVNEDEPDIPFWPAGEEYEHRDQVEVAPALRPLLEQQLRRLEELSVDGILSPGDIRLITDLPEGIERIESIEEETHKTIRQSIAQKSDPESFAPRHYGLFAGEPINETSFITEITGHLGIQHIYRNDPINQFSTLQRPKAFVHFAPPLTLELYIDARQVGNEARYVRKSCFPNARVALFIVPHQGLHFGLFATRNIKAREEITVSHDWNLAHKMEEMIYSVRGETKPLVEVYAPELLQGMASYASTILSVSDHCACRDDRCIFLRLRQAVMSLPESALRRTSSDVMSIDGMPRSDDQEGSEMDEDSRPNSRGKPASRERTPSKDLAIDVHAPQTSREQRKIEQALAQFARMEEKEKDKRKKSDDIDESQGGKRKRQSSIASSDSRPTAPRGMLTTSTTGAANPSKGRGIKRKSLSPSPGADRVSESGASVNEGSPKPGGRIPNRVKRSMKGRPKEPSAKKVRLQPPNEDNGDVSTNLPKWIVRSTLSDNWTPPQLLWFKKYAETAKREYEQSLKESKEADSQVVLIVKPEPTTSTPTANSPSQLSPPPQSENPASTKVPPNLRVTMPSQFQHVPEPPPTGQTPPTSATSSQHSASYFPTGGTPGIIPPASPLGTPSTPKVKLSLADYRARRASGMVTPSIPATDSLSGGEGFAIPSAPSQGSKSPDPKPAEPQASSATSS